jgi:RimJ/RimL family protein N-acetyltransferase
VKRLILPIQTNRLLIRDFVADDHSAIHSYASDPEVARFMYFEPHDDADTTAYVDRVLESQRRAPRLTWELAVVDRRRGEVIGACDLTMPDLWEADLGYVVGRPWWGLGYATEAASAVVHAGFRELELERVYAMCDVSHRASQRVLQKVGLRPKEIVRSAKEAKGRWWDMWLYELRRSEWQLTQPR